MDESEIMYFNRISNAIVLTLFEREHHFNATYKKSYPGEEDKGPGAFLDSANIELELEFDQETCQKGRFYFNVNFPEKCAFLKRAKTATQLSEQIKTPFELGADENKLELVGPFDDSNIEEVKSAILSVDDAVRALYQE